MTSIEKHAGVEYSLSSYKALYSTQEFKDLLKDNPELIIAIKNVVEKTQELLRGNNSDDDLSSEAFSYDEDLSYTHKNMTNKQNNTIKFNFIDHKKSDGFGDYSLKPVVYLEVLVGDQKYFLKASDGNYHSGGVTEALASDYIENLLIQNNIKGVEVVRPIAAYESGQNKYYLSPLLETGKLIGLDDIVGDISIEYSKIPELYHRCLKIQELLTQNNMLDATVYHNMFYDKYNDKILLFDINPKGHNAHNPAS